MIFLKKSTVISILFFLYATLVFTGTFASASDQLMETKKDLNRWPDPVIVSGSLLNTVVGKPIANLRLYAFNKGVFEPIRYQIDEMTEENGDWILTKGPLPNREMSNAAFDTWDKLLFMADDTGDRCQKEAWSQGYTEGIEIEMIDPLTNEKGWCYLLYFDDKPPARSSLPDYIQYDYETETIKTDYFGAQTIITENGEHSNFYKNLYVTEKAGGNGKNFVDRLKLRITIKMFFGSVTIRLTEGRLRGNTLAYKKGPIRLIKRLEQYVLLPGGVKAVRAVADITQYRNIGNSPITFQVPFRMDKLVSSLIIRSGTDYNENIIGSKIYNSKNLQGLLVDGKMDENDLNFDNSFDDWRLITGEFGTYMNRTIPSADVKKYVDIKMDLIDDLTKPNPPEEYPGSVGFIHHIFDVGNAPKGKYVMFLEFYMIPNFSMDDVTTYRNYVDNPIRIRVGRKEAKNQSLLIANLCKKYK